MTYGSLGPDPNPNDISGKISIELLGLKVKPLILKCKQCANSGVAWCKNLMGSEKCILCCIFRLFKVFAVFEHIVSAVPQNFQGRSGRYKRGWYVDSINEIILWESKNLIGLRLLITKHDKADKHWKNEGMFLATTSLSVVQILVVCSKEIWKEKDCMSVRILPCSSLLQVHTNIHGLVMKIIDHCF